VYFQRMMSGRTTDSMVLEDNAPATWSATPSEPDRGSEPQGDAAELHGTDDDSEGARLIALNMALNGTARAETDRYLADNFRLRDRAALLDDVYAAIEP